MLIVAALRAAQDGLRVNCIAVGFSKDAIPGVNNAGTAIRTRASGPLQSH